MPFFKYAMASLTNSVVPSMVSRLGATPISEKKVTSQVVRSEGGLGRREVVKNGQNEVT